MNIERYGIRITCFLFLTLFMNGCGQKKESLDAGLTKDHVLAVNQGRVTLFGECDFKGQSMALSEGEYNLSDLMARGFSEHEWSSVKIEPGYQVFFYEEVNFEGEMQVLKGDEACLHALQWGDKISSLKVVGTQQELFSYQE